MISTLFAVPHRPSEREFRLIDILAQQTADYLERKRAEAASSRSEAWSAGQREAFKAAVNAVPLSESLGVLVRTAVEQMEAPPNARSTSTPARAGCCCALAFAHAYAHCGLFFALLADNSCVPWHAALRTTGTASD